MALAAVPPQRPLSPQPQRRESDGPTMRNTNGRKKAARSQSMPPNVMCCLCRKQKGTLAISSRDFCSICLTTRLLQDRSSPLYGLKEATVTVALQLMRLGDTFADSTLSSAEALGVLQYALERHTKTTLNLTSQAKAVELIAAHAEERVSELALLTMLADLARFAKQERKAAKKPKIEPLATLRRTFAQLGGTKSPQGVASPELADDELAATAEDILDGIFSGHEKADGWMLY